VLSSLLNDRLAEDVRTLRRTNKLIAATGGDQPAARVDIDGRTRRVVPHLVLGPPRPGMIAALADEWSERLFGGWGRLSDVGVLGRFIGGSDGTHGELLSFLLFDPAFHGALIGLGQDHARQALGPAGSPIPWRT
jgi:NTE family protein